LALELK
jgi:hypothetical protein